MGKQKDKQKDDKEIKKKRSKEKRKKQSRSISRSRSNRSKSSNSNSSAVLKAPQKYTCVRGVKPIIQINRNKEKLPRKNKINTNVLSNIISNQKKINRKLDQEQISRAAYNFKQTFTEEIKPVTMSSYLSNQDLLKRIEAKQIKGCLNCQICNIDFQSNYQLLQHLQNHVQQGK